MTKLSQRIISFTLSLCFLTTSIPSGWSTPELPPLKAFIFEIPSELGSIDSIHSAKGPELIHIQTVHGHYETQKKIQGILQHLYKNYGYRTLFVEGSPYKLKPQFLNFFPHHPDLTRKANETLAKEAIVKGSELFLLDHPQAEAYGIENRDTYIANGKAFREVIQAKQKTDRFVKEMNLQIKRLAAAYLSKNLRDFLSREEDFEKHTIDLSSWLQEIKVRAAEHLKINLTDARHQIEWPMLIRYFKVMDWAAKMDSKALHQETQAFLKLIRSSDVYPEIQKILSDTHPKTSSPETEFLFEKAFRVLPVNFDYKKFPQLNYKIGTLVLESEIKGDLLLEEVGKLTDAITGRLAETNEEKEIVSLLNDYRLLQKLFNLELMPKEYESVLEDRRKKIEVSLLPSALIQRFLRVNQANRIRNVQFQHLQEIDELFNKALEFYRLVKQRDHIMMEKVETQIRENKIDRAVIITGGFHSGPFQKYFESQNMNYALVTPKITDFSGDLGREAYIRSILQDTSTASKATLEAPFAALSRAEIRSIHQNPDWFFAKVKEAVRSEARNQKESSEKLRLISAEIERIFPAHFSFREMLIDLNAALARNDLDSAKKQAGILRRLAGDKITPSLEGILNDIAAVKTDRPELRTEGGSNSYPIKILLADKPANDKTIVSIEKMLIAFDGQVQLLNEGTGIGKNEENLKQIILQQNPQIILVRSATNAFKQPAFIHWAKEQGVRAIIRMGAGTDNIDADAARSVRIPVIRTHGNANSVANLTLRFLLAALDKKEQVPSPLLTEDISAHPQGAKIFDLSADQFREAVNASKKGVMNASQRDFVFSPRSPSRVLEILSNLEGKTIGIVGSKTIAQQVVAKLNLLRQEFGIKFEILIASPNLIKDTRRREEMSRLGAIAVDENVLLAQSDIISLHLASSAQAKPFFNIETLAKSPRLRILINTSRQETVETEALKKFLSYRLKGFGWVIPSFVLRWVPEWIRNFLFTIGGYLADVDLIDGKGKTLPSVEPFLHLPNAVMAPHIGASTKDAAEGVEQNTIPALRATIQAMIGQVSNYPLDIVNGMVPDDLTIQSDERPEMRDSSQTLSLKKTNKKNAEDGMIEWMVHDIDQTILKNAAGKGLEAIILFIQIEFGYVDKSKILDELQNESIKVSFDEKHITIKRGRNVVRIFAGDEKNQENLKPLMDLYQAVQTQEPRNENALEYFKDNFGKIVFRLSQYEVWKTPRELLRNRIETFFLENPTGEVRFSSNSYSLSKSASENVPHDAEALAKEIARRISVPEMVKIRQLPTKLVMIISSGRRRTKMRNMRRKKTADEFPRIAAESRGELRMADATNQRQSGSDLERMIKAFEASMLDASFNSEAVPYLEISDTLYSYLETNAKKLNKMQKLLERYLRRVQDPAYAENEIAEAIGLLESILENAWVGDYVNVQDLLRRWDANLHRQFLSKGRFESETAMRAAIIPENMRQPKLKYLEQSQFDLFIRGMRAIARLMSIDPAKAFEYHQKLFWLINMSFASHESSSGRWLSLEIKGGLMGNREWPIHSSTAEDFVGKLVMPYNSAEDDYPSQPGTPPKGWRSWQWREDPKLEGENIVLTLRDGSKFSTTFQSLLDSSIERRKFREAVGASLIPQYDWAQSTEDKALLKSLGRLEAREMNGKAVQRTFPFVRDYQNGNGALKLYNPQKLADKVAAFVQDFSHKRILVYPSKYEVKIDEIRNREITTQKISSAITMELNSHLGRMNFVSELFFVEEGDMLTIYLNTPPGSNGELGQNASLNQSIERAESRHTQIKPEIVFSKLSDPEKLKTVYQGKDMDMFRELYAFLPAKGKYSVTLKIGGTSIAGAILDHEGKVIEEIAPFKVFDDRQRMESYAEYVDRKLKEDDLGKSREEVLGNLREIVLNKMSDALLNLLRNPILEDIQLLDRIGISSPGPFFEGGKDRRGEFGEDGTNLPFNKGLVLGEALYQKAAQQLNKTLPKVEVLHDGAAGVYGEASALGTASGEKNLFYVIWGTGIGTGLIHNGELFTGGELVQHLLGEFGHAMVWMPETQRYEYVGVWSKGTPHHLSGQYYANYQDVEDRIGGGNLAARFRGRSAEQLNDDEIRQIGREMGQAIGAFMKAIAAQYNPQIVPKKIVIGSGVSHLGEPLRKAVQEGFNEEWERKPYEEWGFVLAEKNLLGEIGSAKSLDWIQTLKQTYGAWMVQNFLTKKFLDQSIKEQWDFKLIQGRKILVSPKNGTAIPNFQFPGNSFAAFGLQVQTIATDPASHRPRDIIFEDPQDLIYSSLQEVLKQKHSRDVRSIENFEQHQKNWQFIRNRAEQRFHPPSFESLETSVQTMIQINQGIIPWNLHKKILDQFGRFELRQLVAEALELDPAAFAKEDQKEHSLVELLSLKVTEEEKQRFNEMAAKFDLKSPKEASALILGAGIALDYAGLAAFQRIYKDKPIIVITKDAAQIKQIDLFNQMLFKAGYSKNQWVKIAEDADQAVKIIHTVFAERNTSEKALRSIQAILNVDDLLWKSVLLRHDVRITEITTRQHFKAFTAAMGLEAFVKGLLTEALLTSRSA